MGWLNGEITGLILFFIGIYGLCARRNIIKTIISLSIMQASIILYIISDDLYLSQIPPISLPNTALVQVADPIPQALMITAIVIGVSITAVALTLFISMYHHYGTTNWNKALKKRRDTD